MRVLFRGIFVDVVYVGGDTIVAHHISISWTTKYVIFLTSWTTIRSILLTHVYIPVYQYGQYATQVNSCLTVTDILTNVYETKQTCRVYCFEMSFLKNYTHLTYGRVRVQNNIAISQTPGCCCGPCMLSDGTVYNIDPLSVSSGCCVLSYLCLQQNTDTSPRRIWDYMCGYYGINIDCKVLQFLYEIRENVTPI